MGVSATGSNHSSYTREGTSTKTIRREKVRYDILYTKKSQTQD
jgi:hypothetical protein